MKKHIKKDDDYIGPSRGFAKVFHKLMMTLLFPLRKPLWFLLILAVLFLAPTFRGVKPAEVHLWYIQQIKRLTSQASLHIEETARETMPSVEKVGQLVENITAGVASSGDDKTASGPHLVSQPTPKTSRTAFSVAEPVVAPAEKPLTEKTQVQAPKRPAMPTTNAAASVEKSSSKLNLRYLDVPELVSGVPQIINANELRVAGQDIFLYGIFVQPASEKGLEAEMYLRALTKEKSIDCKINAYTFQNIATAVCTIDGININRRLVERGFSQNVALD